MQYGYETDNDFDIVEAKILRNSEHAYKTSVNYKALAFQRDRNIASMTYEIKRVRAVFDPGLAGGNGGWRCPVGTRYGGQITDRFGRGCGWGVARRLANAITDTGERLEGALDKRRSRRAARQGKRPVRRVGQPAQGVSRRSSRGVDLVAQGGRTISPRTRRGGGAPEIMDRTADEVLQGNFLANRRARRAARAAQNRRKPDGAVSVQRQRRGRNAPEVMDRTADEVLQGRFLANRRARRAARATQNERQASRPQRAQRQRRGEGAPERMERTAREVLEGTFLENRRRRRETARSRRERAQIERTTPSGGNRRTNQPTTTAGTTQRPTRTRNPKPEPESSKPKPESPEKEPKSPKPELESPKKQPKSPKKEPASPPKPPKGPILSNNKRVLYLEDYGFSSQELEQIRRDTWRSVDADVRASEKRLAKRFNDEDLAGMVADEKELEKAAKAQERIARDRSKDVRERNRAELTLMSLNRRINKSREKRADLEYRLLRREGAPEKPKKDVPEKPKEDGPKPSSAIDDFGLSKEVRLNIDDGIERSARDRRRRFADVRDSVQNLEDALKTDEGTLNPESSLELASRIKFDLDSNTEYLEIFVESQQARLDAGASPELSYTYARQIETYQKILDENKDLGERLDAVTNELRKRVANLPSRFTPEQEKRLKDQFAERAKEILARRKKSIGSYLTKRYGKDETPWKDKNLSGKELSDLVNLLSEGDADQKREAQRQLTEWAKSVYELPEFEAGGGYKFQTRVTNVTAGLSSEADPDNRYPVVRIQGMIYGTMPGSGNPVVIGEFSREVKPLGNRRTDRDSIESGRNKPYAVNALLRISDDRFKNTGFATIFNQHAYQWLKGSGIESVNVSAAWDGRFVWGKLGFRVSRNESRRIARALRMELQKIRAGGQSGVINKRDADIIEYLIERARAADYGPDAPQYAEYLMAMRNRDTKRVKNWFTNNIPFSSGTFYLSEVSDDPRR